MTTKIIGTGSYVPELIVTNDDLAKVVDTSDEWIKSRTGIRERRIAGRMGTSELASRAAEAALLNAGVDAKDVDIIILATSSPDNCFPNGACEVQKAIGALNAVAFDISAACTGFVYALNIMHGFLKSGLYKTGIVIGADVMSKLTDWTDRRTCVLFGDGAGAAVVRSEEYGLVHMVMKSDGSKSHALVCKARTAENFSTGKLPELGYTTMDGQEVFKFAVKRVPECIRQVLRESGTDINEIKYFVTHQANYRIFQSIAKRLKIPIDRFPVNMDRYGNTSGASIPLILDEINREGKLQSGDKLILSGFGAGLTWGATLIEW